MLQSVAARCRSSQGPRHGRSAFLESRASSLVSSIPMTASPLCRRALAVALVLACAPFCAVAKAAAPVAASASATRAAAWREDLDVVRDQFLARDRSYPSDRHADAAQRLRRLRERAGRLDDVEIAAELARIAAL